MSFLVWLRILVAKYPSPLLLPGYITIEHKDWSKKSRLCRFKSVTTFTQVIL